jgi:hypothetical protein
MARKVIGEAERIKETIRKNMETLKINVAVLAERHGIATLVEDTVWGQKCDVEDLQLFFQEKR